MMRRKNTSRRVHALSSVSIRADEIAATDMAVSRGWEGGGVSDMRIIVHDRERTFFAETHGPSARQNQSSPEMVRKLPKLCGRSRLREVSPAKAAVTQAIQGVKIGTGPIRSAGFRRYNHMAIKFGRPIEMRDAPRRDVLLPRPGLDLVGRPRRNRKAEWARRLVPENVLTTDDLIGPLFPVDRHTKRAD